MHAYACISMSLCIEHSYPCLRVSTTGPDFGIWAPSPKPITFLFKSDRIGPFLGSAPPGPDFGIWAPSPKPMTFLLKSYRIGPFPGSAPPGPDFGIWAPSPKPIKHSYPCIKHSYAYPCLCVSNISIDVLVYEPQLSMCLCIGHCVSAIPIVSPRVAVSVYIQYFGSFVGSSGLLSCLQERRFLFTSTILDPFAPTGFEILDVNRNRRSW